MSQGIQFESVIAASKPAAAAEDGKACTVAANPEQAAEVPADSISYTFWAALYLLSLLALVAYKPLPWYWLVLLLLGMSYLSIRHLAARAAFQKKMWLDLYVLPESTWRTYLLRSPALGVLATLTSVFLAVVTYLALYAERLAALVAIAGMICLADIVSRVVTPLLLANLVKAYAELTTQRLFAATAVLLVLAGLAVTDLCESLFSDYSMQNARTIADRTIEEVKHPVVLVRHWVRTIRYYDFTLLRVRDSLGWPVGWAVYFALLIPSAVPAAGAYSIYRGIKHTLHDLKET